MDDVLWEWNRKNKITLRFLLVMVLVTMFFLPSWGLILSHHFSLSLIEIWLSIQLIFYIIVIGFYLYMLSFSPIYFRVYSNYIEIKDKKGNNIIVTKGDFNICYNYISRAFSPFSIIFTLNRSDEGNHKIELRNIGQEDIKKLNKILSENLGITLQLCD